MASAVVLALWGIGAVHVLERSIAHIRRATRSQCVMLQAEQSNAKAYISTLGASLQALIHPDGTDVVLGWQNYYHSYLSQCCFVGCVVGPIANRTRNGRLYLSDGLHQLSLNENGSHHHHGGFTGLHKAHWSVYKRSSSKEVGDSVSLICQLPAGAEGYPVSTLWVAQYTLIDAGESSASLDIKLMCINEGDSPTGVSPALHSYLNPAGASSATADAADDLVLQLPNSEYFLPLDSANIAHDGPASVALPEHQHLDLRSPTSIASAPKLLDTYFFVGDPSDRSTHKDVSQHIGAPNARNSVPMLHAAKLTDPVSGRTIDVLSDAPGAQVFTGGVPTSVGKYNTQYGPRNAIAVEPHWPPNATQIENVPNIELPSGNYFSMVTRYLLW